MLAGAGRRWKNALRRPSADCGYELVRAHPYKESEKHGFISSQKEGMQVFAGIDPNAPLIVAEAVWQYSHHVLHGLIDASRADSDGRELVGHLAGAGRHAESQWLAHQGRREIFDDLERGFHRRLLPRLSAALARRRPRQAQDAARHASGRTCKSAAKERSWARRWPSNC